MQQYLVSKTVKKQKYESYGELSQHSIPPQREFSFETILRILKYLFMFMSI